MEDYNITRFIDAQEGVYPAALNELRQGYKRSHWMWYIFPQLKQLGHSYNSQFYGLAGIDEATEYLAHPVLGQRLKEVCEVILELPGDDAEAVFGFIDAKKLRSSMTLFDLVSPNSLFAQVLDKYYRGSRDDRTLSLLSLE